MRGTPGGDDLADQRDRAGGVVGEVALRVLDRLADQRQRREVQHAVVAVAVENPSYRGTVGDIGLDELDLGRHGVAVPGDEAVEDGDLVATLAEDGGDDAADVAGTASDEQLHGILRAPGAGSASKTAGARKPRSANAACTALSTAPTSSTGTIAMTDPPNPPPIIRAPSAPADSATSTAVSVSGTDTS